MRTVAHLYDSYETALEVTRELEAAGFSHDDVSMVANQGSASVTPMATTGTGTSTAGTTAMDGTMLDETSMGSTAMGAGTMSNAPLGTTGATGNTYAPTVGDTDAAPAAGTGASIGTIIGGGAGLLAGIGALAIPGVGPVVAAGWLIATLTGAGAGAAAGGLLGALTGSGVAEDHAHVYTESVRRGSTLVTVRAEDSRAVQAESIMAGFSPIDVAQRGSDYRATGDWTGFDENRGALSADELAAERLRNNPRTGI